MLTAAVVGLGVGEQHARGYLRAGCRLRIFDRDAARIVEVLARLGDGVAADSFEAILADPNVDVVSLASYDDAHAAQVVAALSARKHVFVEKPMCRTREELVAIHRAWLKSGRHLCSNLVLRAAPLYRWLKTAIDCGELGIVYAFDGDYLFGRIQKITDGWRGQVDNFAVMLSGGVHLVDLMLWLLGERPGRVSAVGNRICTAGTAFRYPDFVATTYQFPSGAVGRITANFGCVHGHQHVVRVFGTKATFIYDDQGARLQASRDPAPPPTPIDLSPLPASKGELIPEFVAAIAAGADDGASAQREFDLIGACAVVEPALARRGDVLEVDYV